MIPEQQTFTDLINSDDTWEYEESLEEVLFDTDALLEDTFGRRPLDLRKGDIIMAPHGKSVNKLNDEFTKAHRIYVLTDATGPIGDRVFTGFLLSSKVEKANINDPRFPDNIYIKDYSTILFKGPPAHKEAFIKLGVLYTIYERELSGGSWKGRANNAFVKFIDNTLAEMAANKDVSYRKWLGYTPRYNSSNTTGEDK